MGSSGLPSIWIPLALLFAIVGFMVRQFMGERRQNAEIEREEREAAALAAAKPAEASNVVNEAAAEPATTQSTVAPIEAAPAPVAAEATQTVVTPAKEPARKLRPFRRTAFIWVPFVAGFITQGYFDFGKDYVDLGQAYNDIIMPLVSKYLS